MPSVRIALIPIILVIAAGCFGQQPGPLVPSILHFAPLTESNFTLTLRFENTHVNDIARINARARVDAWGLIGSHNDGASAQIVEYHGQGFGWTYPQSFFNETDVLAPGAARDFTVTAVFRELNLSFSGTLKVEVKADYTDGNQDWREDRGLGCYNATLARVDAPGRGCDRFFWHRPLD